MSLKIGDWTVVPSLNHLEREGESIKLEPRTMDVLVYLANAGDRVVSADELLRGVWQGRVFDDGIVYSKITRLRKALGDDPQNPKYIATIPKRGYRLVATVTRSDNDAAQAPATAGLPAAPTPPTNVGPKSRTTITRRAALGLPIALTILIGAAVTLFMRDAEQPRVTGTAPRSSIAVLPFDDLSPDPADAYFAAGVHEEILSQLSRIKALSVISRTSVLRYADTTLSVPEVGKELGVASIMEGSVRYADGRIRVTVQLVDARSDRRLWGETYEHELSNIFAIQSDIASNVAKALAAELLPAERARIDVPPTQSIEAYALLLRAGELVPPDSVALLEQAIAIDDRFALAHATLARILAFALTNTISVDGASENRRADIEQRASALAAKAIEIDPDVSEAHTALGILAHTSWRWTEALTELARAVEIAPHDLIATNVYGSLLSALGRHDEAIAVAERALALNPGDPNAGWYAFHLASARSYDAAARVFRDSIAVAPRSLLYRDWLAFVELARGNVQAAVLQLELAEQLAADDRLIAFLPEWAYGYSLAGRRQDAERIFAEIEGAAEAGRSPGAGGWAMAYLAIGDERRALEWLRAAEAKAAAHERDEGFYNLMVLRMNIPDDPALRKPELASVLSRIKGD